MKKTAFFILLFALFCSNSYAGVRYYIEDGESPSSKDAQCIVCYFNEDYSRCVYNFQALSVIKSNLIKNSSFYDDWGRSYVNSNTCGWTYFVARFTQTAQNAHIYVNISTISSFIAPPYIAFSLDFNKVKTSTTEDQLYNEFNVSQLTKSLF